MPVMPGILTSVTTQASLSFGSAPKNSSARSNAHTSKPWVVSRNSSESRAAGSSSITYTVRFLAMGMVPNNIGYRQSETKIRAAARIIIDPKLSAMSIYNGTRY